MVAEIATKALGELMTQKGRPDNTPDAVIERLSAELLLPFSDQPANRQTG